jgi:ADP-ribosyl-[dinitrogen reductase] hydrolase
MVQGSCACGAVQYEAKEIYGPFIFCHCDDCKKTHSTAFSANATVKSDEFAFTQGEDKLSIYKPFPNKTRYFCSVCGSHIMHKMDEDAEHIKIKVGTVTAVDGFDLANHERYHIFCEYDTPWTDYENCKKHAQVRKD